VGARWQINIHIASGDQLPWERKIRGPQKSPMGSHNQQEAKPSLNPQTEKQLTECTSQQAWIPQIQHHRTILHEAHAGGRPRNSCFLQAWFFSAEPATEPLNCALWSLCRRSGPETQAAGRLSSPDPAMEPLNCAPWSLCGRLAPGPLLLTVLVLLSWQ
jgi:hypothetical protein